MDTLVSVLWVGLGSALGGIGRFLMAGAIDQRIGETFPVGTFTVNVVGCFLIGLIATVTGPDGRLLVGTTTRQFVMIGFLGGYTTFSSFSLQTLNLAQDGDWLRAGLNVVGSVVLCLFGVWLGYAAGLLINR